jgi:hypothetical protein
MKKMSINKYKERERERQQLGNTNDVPKNRVS